MRKMTMLAAAAMLALAPAALAQEQAPAATQQQPPAAAPEAGQSAAPTIQKIEVVDVADLPEAEQARITAASEQTAEADLQSLRNSIDANGQASAALQAKGLTSASVIAAAMGADGTLTLITRKS
jgi:hypothetical protein